MCTNTITSVYHGISISIAVLWMPFSMYHEGKSQEGTSLFSCIVFAVQKFPSLSLVAVVEDPLLFWQ